jgi:hypothetical protein
MTVHTPRSEPLAKPRRPARRSMVELTASLASGAVAEKLSSELPVATRRSINAAPDDANRLTSANLSPDFGSEAADRPREPEKAGGTPKAERQLPPLVKAVAEYRAKSFELMTANVNATLDYARQLANVRSLPEFIQLSTNHARKHVGLMMTQTAALRALSQSLTASSAERMTVSPAKALSRKEA